MNTEKAPAPRLLAATATPGAWHVEAPFADAPEASPERAWLRTVSQDFNFPMDTLDALLQELSVGWSVRTAMSRASVPGELADRSVDVLQRLAQAGVLTRNPSLVVTSPIRTACEENENDG